MGAELGEIGPWRLRAVENGEEVEEVGEVEETREQESLDRLTDYDDVTH